jgi:hypothetical protein
VAIEIHALVQYSHNLDNPVRLAEEYDLHACGGAPISRTKLLAAPATVGFLGDKTEHARDET